MLKVEIIYLQMSTVINRNSLISEGVRDTNCNHSEGLQVSSDTYRLTEGGQERRAGPRYASRREAKISSSL